MRLAALSNAIVCSVFLTAVSVSTPALADIIYNAVNWPVQFTNLIFPGVSSPMDVNITDDVSFNSIFGTGDPPSTKVPYF